MGRTYKDSRDRYEERPTTRHFRDMKHNKKQVKSIPSRCGVSNKIGFRSMEAAQKRADEIIRDGARDGIIRFRIYQCPDCRLFHLTKDLEGR